MSGAILSIPRSRRWTCACSVFHETPEEALAFVGELRAVRCDRTGQDVDRFFDPGQRLVLVPGLAVVELVRTRGGAEQGGLFASHCGLR